ncbi:MAG: hypothetical protein DCC75_00515 [Proteobacteria bacterium]|nr:MAG: hypothetical protein DCC75_00515 [Pseudomonadota bacterium]
MTSIKKLLKIMVVAGIMHLSAVDLKAASRSDCDIMLGACGIACGATACIMIAQDIMPGGVKFSLGEINPQNLLLIGIDAYLCIEAIRICAGK